MDREEQERITSNDPGLCSPESATSCSICFPGDQREILVRFRQRGQSDLVAASRNRDSSLRCHRPFLSMPIKTTSLFIRVDGGDDILRGLQGDFMLCGMTAE
jgi:hypothetical protein